MDEIILEASSYGFCLAVKVTIWLSRFGSVLFRLHLEKKREEEIITQYENAVPYVYTKVLKDLGQPTIGVGRRATVMRRTLLFSMLQKEGHG